jgi:transposase InsO family protein
MTEAAAILERVRRFQFDRFTPDTEEWRYYIQRFETELAIHGLLEGAPTELHRRNLLLSRVGPAAFRIVVDHFRPAEVNTKTYAEIKQVLQQYYQKSICIMAERVVFAQRQRKDDETVTQFLNTLRSLAGNCDFGDSLHERLRDQLVIGISNDTWQKEIFRLHPTNAATLAQVEATVLVLEQASLQQQRLQGLTKTTSFVPTDSSVRRVMRPSTKRPTSSSATQSQRQSASPPRQLIRGKNCFKCGNNVHKVSEVCPADSAVCSACHKDGHFARVCVKSGRAVISSISNQRRRLHHLTVDDDSDCESQSLEFYDEINTIASVSSAGKFAVRYAKLNDCKVRMLYDPGAAFSVINKQVWQQIGSPSLSAMPNLLAYTKVPIKTLGSATISVNVFHRQKQLPVCVVETDDVPLFGLDWLLAFDVALPEGVSVCSVTSATAATQHPTSTSPSFTEQPQPPLPSQSIETRLQQLLTEYADIFKSGHGRIRCQEAVVHIDPNARPKAFAARPVPFPLRKGVEAELERLVSEGILEPVDPMVTPIEWASPIVIAFKASGDIRICGDFKVTINQHIITDNYPLPRFEEIASTLNNCKYFSVIDLKDAFLQLPVSESSRKYLVIATHKGYFRYTRLPFGVNFAPSLFQATMDKILAGVQSTSAFIDDVITGADTADRQLEILRSVFGCLRSAGIRTQLSKCRFLQSSVRYLGHRIDATGIHPTDERLSAIRDMARPTNRKQLRSFLGAINYYSKFIAHLQSTCEPLHRLTRNDTPWEWTDEHDAIFTALKDRLTSSETLVHYDNDKPLIIATDASDTGIGAVLMHRFPDGSERPIAFASRLLSDVERRYAAIDKEALAIVYAVDEKFQQYILGRRFILKTDHKPLERLLGSKSQLPKLAASRLARWAMTLSMYDYDIQYHAAGLNTPADVLSRFPVDPAGGSVAEMMGVHSNLLHLKLQDITVSKRELQQKTITDPVLAQVVANMERGWPVNTASLPKELHTFFEKRAELSLEENMLLWRGRIVVPVSLQTTMLQLLHEGHPGISAMRDLAKFYAWWPHIDDDIEHQVASCSACQQGRSKEPEVPLFSWSVPSEPWSRIHIDFAGPFENFMWLVIIDAYTKWIEVIKMKSTTTAATCDKLREVFARLGIPRVLVSDNGPQLTSDEFKQFCKSNSIHHICSTPYHPKTNGLAERAVRTFKERMSAAKGSADLNTCLARFLLSCRNTPQKSTGRPPAEIMFGRRLRTRLDLLKPDVRARMDAANFRQQRDHDRSTVPRSFGPGDPVWVMNNSTSGHQSGEIVRRTGPLSYVVRIGEARVRKHADQLRFRRTADAEQRGIDADPVDDVTVKAVAELGLPPMPSAPPATIRPEPISSVPPPPELPPSDATPPAAVVADPPVVADHQLPQTQTTDITVPQHAQTLRRSQRTRRCPAVPYDKYL